MSPLTLRVLRTVRRHGLLAPGDRVAIALSGGPDSVALTWLLHEVAVEVGASLAGLIHVNHGLRGDESAEDEAFCRALAERGGWAIEVARVDVAARARAERRSMEAAAREARYECLAAAADRLGATRVATGHTLDDQAETVLLRLLRGAGTRGLSGIRIRRGPYVRPLLECRRAELAAYLARRGEAFRVDRSNSDRSIARNRLRHELLPVIEQLAPAGVRALARVAALSADDETFFSQAVTETAPSVVLVSTGIGRGTPGGMPGGAPIRLDVQALAGLPAALSRRLVRRTLETIVPAGHLSARHIEAVLGLSTGRKVHGHLDLPGVVVERRAGVLVIRAATDVDRLTRRGSGDVQFEYPLPCPGAVVIPEAGVTISASVGGSDTVRLSGRGDVAAVRIDAFAPPFVVRNRRPGDRLRPLGAPGRRKLQDLLVDRKVPRTERDRVPIVIDAAGRIVWVAGLAMAEEGRATAAGGVVILTVKSA
jgi:tRNA(Ile)-lysidine synthase